MEVGFGKIYSSSWIWQDLSLSVKSLLVIPLAFGTIHRSYGATSIGPG